MKIHLNCPCIVALAACSIPSIAAASAAVDITPIEAVGQVIDQQLNDLIGEASSATRLEARVGGGLETWVESTLWSKGPYGSAGADDESELFVAHVLTAVQELSQFARNELAMPDDGTWEREVGDAVAKLVPWPLELLRNAALPPGSGAAEDMPTTSGEWVLSHLQECRYAAERGNAPRAVSSALEAATATERVKALIHDVTLELLSSVPEGLAASKLLRRVRAAANRVVVIARKAGVSPVMTEAVASLEGTLTAKLPEFQAEVEGVLSEFFDALGRAWATLLERAVQDEAEALWATEIDHWSGWYGNRTACLDALEGLEVEDRVYDLSVWTAAIERAANVLEQANTWSTKEEDMVSIVESATLVQRAAAQAVAPNNRTEDRALPLARPLLELEAHISSVDISVENLREVLSTLDNLGELIGDVIGGVVWAVVCAVAGGAALLCCCCGFGCYVIRRWRKPKTT